jgi:nicotinamidase-related amidase
MFSGSLFFDNKIQRYTTMNKKALNIQLVVIDPQNDFMDRVFYPQMDPKDPLVGYKPALPVTGATDDMIRLAAMVRRLGRKIDDVHVTLDSHQLLDIAHPAYWRDAKGHMPNPFTIITTNDIETGIWKPFSPTLQKRALAYAKALEQTANKYPLMIWPPHCLIGSIGHNVQSDLYAALGEWSILNGSTIDYVTKGTNPHTEHYGALMAEVPDPNDAASQLNTDFLDLLRQADIVALAGEASSHCVLTTVNQIVMVQ